MRTKPGATRVGGLQPSNQRAVQGIAKNILCRPIGARLETTLQYQQDLGVGAGTVQKALRLVESVGAARLRQAGHRGTFIEEHDLGLLWNLADLDHVRIALTPPGALEQYGLAAGLTEEFGRVDVPISQHFARGGERRLALLAQSETDVAVVSRGAAQQIMGNTEWQFFELGPHSYYSEDSLLVVSLQRARRGRGSAPKRVGIDRTSRDHEQLTLAEFPPEDGYEYVDCAFPQIPAAVLEDKIDTGVWHRMLLLVGLDLMGLATRPMRSTLANNLRTRISSAVLVCRADDQPVAAVLRELDMDAVLSTQRSFVDATEGSVGLPSLVWGR